MNLKIQRTHLKEARELLQIQKEAFKSDLQRYDDFPYSPAAESLPMLIDRIKNSYHYSVFINNELAGALDIRKLSHDHYYLYRVYLKPSFHNKGYGSHIMKWMENEFPDAKRWSLDTPKDNAQNHHFYEKLGYKEIGEHKLTRKLTLLDYEKVMDGE